jgi:hypothetical protein
MREMFPNNSSESDLSLELADRLMHVYTRLDDIISRRLMRLGSSTRNRVTTVNFDLSGKIDGLSALTVGRHFTQKPYLSLPLEITKDPVEGTELTTVIVNLQRWSDQPERDYALLAGLINNLDVLESAKATATVVTEVKLRSAL